jgi:hypothetical protein
MTIKFVCSCGKHLRARDDMAAHRVVCPRCRCLVGVPSLQPTHPGTAANPMTPEERRRNARQRPPAPAAEGVRAATAVDALVDAAGLAPDPAALHGDLARRLQDPSSLVTLRAAPRRRREVRWYHCLAYPFRAWPLVLILGVAWAGWVAAVLAGLPLAAHELAGDPSRLRLAGGSWLFVSLLFAGFTAGFLDCTLVAAAAGEVARVRWPGTDLLLIGRSLGRWLFAFVAGPAPLAAAGFFYWLHGGDLGLLDWLILVELGVLAVSYGVFAVAAAGERQRFRDANPLAVARLLRRLGPRALVVPVAALAALGLGRLAWVAVEESHHTVAAWLWLPVAGVGGVFLTTFLFRLLGVWCFRARPAPQTQARSASDGK